METTISEYLDEQGKSNVKSVGGGVYEIKIDFGPGYRIYFGNENQNIIILLCGGTKKRQPNDIELAKKLWQRYKLRKKLTSGIKNVIN